MRTLSKYFTGENDENQLFDGTFTSFLIKPQQVFVSSFVGHKASVPSLTEFEMIGVAPVAYVDTQGNLVLPPQSGIEYVSAFGVDLGTITGEYEISDDSGFTSIVASGSLHPTNQTVFPIGGLVGSLYVRYRLSSSTLIFSTFFTDVGSPFTAHLDPVIQPAMVSPQVPAAIGVAVKNVGNPWATVVSLDPRLVGVNMTTDINTLPGPRTFTYRDNTITYMALDQASNIDTSTYILSNYSDLVMSNSYGFENKFWRFNKAGEILESQRINTVIYFFKPAALKSTQNPSIRLTLCTTGSPFKIGDARFNWG